MRFLSDTKTNSSNVLLSSAAPPPEAVALESDYVVILAALLCALICVVGLLAVARCAWLRRRSTGVDSYFHTSSANKGLKKKVLESLPMYDYTTSGDSKLSSEDCAICLVDFADGDQIRVLPQCDHAFHLTCIDTWLGSHSSCPSCRKILVVGRCQKCGQFPATAARSSVAVVQSQSEARLSAAIANSSIGFLP